MPTTPPKPSLTIQTASLFASGDNSTFTGTGGPAAYDPFLGGFSDVVSSSGLFAEPFQDQVYQVDAGDQVAFVIAVQNFGQGAAAYDLKLRNTMPVGFTIPTNGQDITVTDGAGNALDTSGDLFDPNGGLAIRNPVAGFDQNSGANVVLVTFTLQATSSVSVPLANITNTAQIVSYAASEGGANLSGSAAPGTLSASTAVQTGGIQVASAADQQIASLAPGHTASFDITVTVPEGTTRDLRIDEILPQTGTSWFQLVSAQIVQFGANLSASLPVMVLPNGSVSLGTVVDTPDNLQTAADQITVRVTVQGGGTAAGQGQLNTVVSAADPNTANGRWSSTVSNTLALDKPDIAPIIAGISAGQNATFSMQVLPFSGLVLTDPDVSQTQTLTIHASNPALGTLTGAPTNSTGDIVLSGTIGAVQAAARSLVFKPASGATGTATFSLRLDDGFGGIATDARTAVTVANAADTSDLVHFPLSSSQTVLTSTATGSSTYAQVETYAGAVDNVQSQFIYDGAAPLAIVAQQPGMLIRSQADATAVQLLGGNNVLDMSRGSSFLVSGPGRDVFLFHADQPHETWNTVVNFHAGDSVTLWGFKAGTSTDWWVPSAGAANYTGATLRADINADGRIDSSVTFAGKTLADTAHFTLQTGNVAGADYLQITTG